MESAPAKFAEPGKTLTEGEIGMFYRGNGNNKGGNIAATYANESFSIHYTADMAEGDNYSAGKNFKSFTETGRGNETLARDVVGSTAYKTRNQSVTFALKGNKDQLDLRIGYQDIPYQLYPNQRMDMLANTQYSYNLHYLGQKDWGSLEARAYHQSVDHYMDFGVDKKYNYGNLIDLIDATKSYPVNGMPMYTSAETTGFSSKADIFLSEETILRLGGEYQNYKLNDWWPPVPDCGYTGALANCSGGMAPDTFWNIRDGKRERIGLFSELENQWNANWKTLLGIRIEQVTTDASDIQGYHNQTNAPVIMGSVRNMYATSSVGTISDFNNLSRKRTDHNVDFTAIAQDVLDENHTLEFGYARKTRSPNLYERYSWSTNGMALEMNNFVGDGNGYLGNPNLKAEVAHNLGVTFDWHSVDKTSDFIIAPFFSYVDNYIDAVRCPSSLACYTIANSTVVNQFVKLQYANQTARLYGIDISGKIPLDHNNWGNWGLLAVVNYTHGTDLASHDGLYNIMPVNGKLTLTQKIAGWDNRAELIAVKGKEDISAVRNEFATPGYSLLNLRSSYSWSKFRVDFGVENVFDKLYYQPLGGAYVGQGATMSLNREAPPYVTMVGGTAGTNSLWGLAIPGPGRNIYIGASMKF